MNRNPKTTETPAAITSIEDASAARWLASALEPARARGATEPTDEAIERIRARVFGERPRRAGTLAA